MNQEGIQLLRYHKMIRIWILPPPLFELFDFGNPLRPHSLKRSKLYVNPIPQPLTKTVKFAIS